MRKMFEFGCSECNHYEEKLVRCIKEAPVCPNGHGQMEKLVSTPTFHFTDGAGTDMGKAYAFHGRPLWGGND